MSERANRISKVLYDNGQTLIDRDIADWLIAERDERIRRANVTANRLAADCDRYMQELDEAAAERDDLSSRVLAAADALTRARSDDAIVGGRGVVRAITELVDSRDDLIEQHDADAATIAELRAVAAWLVAEERYWKIAARKRHLALEDAVKTLPYKTIQQNYSTDPPVATIVLKEPYTAEVVFDDQLPTPDATNPDHLRFTAEVLANARNVMRPVDLPRDLREEADRLERERVEVDATEKLIEKVAKAIVANDHDSEPHLTPPWGEMDQESRGSYVANARALHAAGLLRDGGES